MATTKRASTVPVGPKPPTSISPKAIISDAAFIIGTTRITIGESTVLHPRSKLDSTNAPVTLGDYCIICERSVVGLSNLDGVRERVGEDRAQGVAMSGVTVGNGVSIEAGAIVEAQSISDGCLIEANARIGPGAVLGQVTSQMLLYRRWLNQWLLQYCRVGPMCEVKAGEVVPDYTVIYGVGKRRVDGSGIQHLRMATMKRHVDVLGKLIPSNPAKWQ
ncbi:MAG: hypothetical protein M4579_006549 [Chaenotheca gracillima]|nr:MAG: hypothetical protein M4579_006549 [Chaenotheca gracillima]